MSAPPVNAKGAVKLPDGGVAFLPFDCERCSEPSAYWHDRRWLCTVCMQLDFLSQTCDNGSVS